jgi:hypothetical protein
MKAVINTVALFSALAGTSSNAYAYKLRGGAHVRISLNLLSPLVTVETTHNYSSVSVAI